VPRWLCLRFFCVLMALGLLIGFAGDAKAQPSYASGQIVGWYDGPEGRHGFLLDQGNYSTLDVPSPRR
jgi:hypothetical protein